MESAGMARADLSTEDMLALATERAVEAEQTLEANLAPVRIVNHCSDTLLWSQSWAAFVVRYGWIGPGGETNADCDVYFYDFTFTCRGRSITKTMVKYGSTLTISDMDF